MLRLHRHTDPRFAPVVEIILDRPEKRNALTAPMLTALADHARELDADPSCRVVLLRGEGPVFCAGFDLALCLEDPDQLARMLTALSHAARTLRRLTKPVVIAAHGGAIAGGCALLGGADLVITNTAAKLGYPVVKLGISPAVTAPLLNHSITGRAVRERLLDPELITGERALALGLVDRCVDTIDDVLPRAQIDAAKLAEKPPRAMAVTRAWLSEIEGSDLDAHLDMALASSLSLVNSAEQRELLAAAFAKHR